TKDKMAVFIRHGRFIASLYFNGHVSTGLTIGSGYFTTYHPIAIILVGKSPKTGQYHRQYQNYSAAHFSHIKIVVNRSGLNCAAKLPLRKSRGLRIRENAFTEKGNDKRVT